MTAGGKGCCGEWNRNTKRRKKESMDACDEKWMGLGNAIVMSIRRRKGEDLCYIFLIVVLWDCAGHRPSIQ